LERIDAVSLKHIRSIRTYRKQAFSAAALIAVIIAARNEPTSALVVFRKRQDDLLHDLLHDFAFKSRKLIELATADAIPAKSWASQGTIMGFRSSTTDSLIEKFKHYSLWFILNRVIHSDSLLIIRAPVQINPDHQEITHRLPWAFQVRSDFDSDDKKQHLVFIDELLKCFITFDKQLREHLKSPQHG
jgi:hypothetical protein